MPGTPRIAVIGADEPLGEALLKGLEARELSRVEVVPISLGDTEGCATYYGEDLPYEAIAEVSWQGVHAVAVAARGPAAAKQAAQLLADGLPVVALAGLVPPGVGVLQEASNAPAAAIGRVIGPLASRAGLASLSGFVGLPVAARGRAGIEELASQSRALFALEAVEPEVFPVQIAFNLLAQVGEVGQDGLSEEDRTLRREVRHALGGGTTVQLMAAWLPTFYGGIAALHGRFGRAVRQADLRDWLEHVPGVTLMDDPLPGGIPTPATDAVDSTDVFVGRLHVENPEGDAAATLFSLWLTYDHPRLEAAQMLQGLEKVIESALN